MRPNSLNRQGDAVEQFVALAVNSMATDYMVWNVTKDDIRVRMAVIDEDIWPQPAVGEKLPPDRSSRIGFTDFVLSGREPFPEVVKKIYDDINAEYGTDYKVPTD